jgi:predicted small metal-binding protein
MQQQVKCECGYQAREDNEEALVKTVLGHVNDNHPELVDQVTPDVVRDWIELIP